MNPTTRTRAARVARVVWVLGFLVGTVSHVVDLASAGAETYAGYPGPIRLFWLSLTLLDPAVIALVLLRRRAGVMLGVAVMVADVAVNWTVYATIGPPQLFGVLSQTLFALVVLATAHPLWQWFGAGEGRSFPTTAAPGLPCKGPPEPPTDS